MGRIDQLHLLCPFAGSLMARDLLRREGVQAGRLHVVTLRSGWTGGPLPPVEHVEAGSAAQDRFLPDTQAGDDAACPQTAGVSAIDITSVPVVLRLRLPRGRRLLVHLGRAGGAGIELAGCRALD